MTQDQLIQTVHETLLIEVNEAALRGLDPMHIANVLMIAAIEIAVSLGGPDAARAGLKMAAEQIEG